MSWIVFLIALAIAVTLDNSFLQILAIGPVFPGVCGALVVFVALFAPRLTALWAALITGLVLDLGSPSVTAEGLGFHVIGPHALGFVLGAYLVVLLRSVVVRRNPFTVGMLVVPCLLALGAVSMAIWSVRGFYSEGSVPWGNASLGSEFGRTIGWVVYSALLAIPVGWMLLLSWSVWRFDPTIVRASRH